MASFHHHPDELIYIRIDEGVYVAKVDDFAADLGEAYAGLPDGFRERYYEPGEKHFIASGDGAESQPMPWAEGDAYIAAFDTLMAAMTAREIPPPPTDAEKWALIKKWRDELLAATDFVNANPTAPFTAAQRSEWENYQSALRQIPLLWGFPNDDPELVDWPARPFPTIDQVERIMNRISIGVK